MILWEAYRDFVCLTMVLGTLIYDTRAGLSTAGTTFGSLQCVLQPLRALQARAFKPKYINA